ncbi:MAG: DUF2141 domain-containing protein [Gammaproteobacteria bacterium]|nr:DUF2141 domain-containing protein [Gammaproteobacteria bacterium]MCF6362674.1 DUF2141 domain-containing protein [Gammaproteobacteria bacterium]
MTNHKVPPISRARAIAIKCMLLGILLTQETVAMNWTEINLTVTDIDVTRGGEIIVLVFQEKGFPKDHSKALKKYIFVAKNNPYNLKITVPNAVFALKIHHDEDRSGSVKKNWTGIIPAEGIGFSSGAKIRFGPPSFEAARMQPPDSGEVAIAIRYP